MGEFYRSIDTVLMGRTTYDIGRKLGQSHYPGKKNYIFSRRRRRAAPHVEFVKENVGVFARRLRGTRGKNIWMVGGAELIAAFLDAGEIDEFVIHVVPVVIGEGIPLIAPRHRAIELKLRSSKRYPDGVVRLHYTVVKN